jgi:hypothetical protein
MYEPNGVYWLFWVTRRFIKCADYTAPSCTLICDISRYLEGSNRVVFICIICPSIPWRGWEKSRQMSSYGYSWADWNPISGTQIRIHNHSTVIFFNNNENNNNETDPCSSNCLDLNSKVFPFLSNHVFCNLSKDNKTNFSKHRKSSAIFSRFIIHNYWIV